MPEEEFKKLSALDDLADLEAVADIVKDTKVDGLTDLEAVADIVKDTKVGQGLNFLPRTLDGLHKSWQLLQK